MKKSIVAKVLAFSFLISTFTGVTIPVNVASAEEVVQSEVSATTSSAVSVTTKPAIADMSQYVSNDSNSEKKYTVKNEFDETTGNYKYEVIKSKNVLMYLTSADLGVSVTPNVRPDVKDVPETFEVENKDKGVTYILTRKIEDRIAALDYIRVYYVAQVKTYPVTEIFGEDKFEKCIGWYDGELVRQSDTNKAIKLYKKYKNKKKIIIKAKSSLAAERIYASMLYKYARYSNADVCAYGKKITVKTKTFKKYIKASKKAIKKKSKYAYKRTKKRQNWMTKYMNYTLENAEKETSSIKDSSIQRYTTVMEKWFSKAINKFDIKYDMAHLNYAKGTSKKDSKYGAGQSAYDIIDNQVAVCAGITRFACMYYESLGIKCEFVADYKINHAWNKFPDGFYYNNKLKKTVDYTQEMGTVEVYN